jgi:hypothetical protein
LAPPVWEVRFARFDGEVAERAEEWRVSVDGRGRVRVVSHALPEARPGARLSRDEALALASRAVRDQLGTDPSALRLVGAFDQSRPARTDWAFVWHDPAIEIGGDGEARVRAFVLGDEPTGIGRTVHVPESWLRAERAREQWRSIARLVGGGLAVAIAFAAFIIGVVAWSRGHSDRRASVWVASLVLALGIVRSALSWPEIAFALDTTEPVASQLAIRFALDALSMLTVALISGLFAGVGAWWARAAPVAAEGSRMRPWLTGVAAALAILGVAALASQGAGDTSPSWPNYAFEDKALPWLAALLQPLRLPAAVGIVLFGLAALTHYTADGTRRMWMLPLLLALIFGVAVLEDGTFPALAVAGAMVTGAAAAAIVEAVVRTEPRCVPAFVATSTLLIALDDALEKDSAGGYAMFALQAVMTIAVTALVTRYLARPLPPQPTADVLARPGGHQEASG